jgi:hypothetical protein
MITLQVFGFNWQIFEEIELSNILELTTLYRLFFWNSEMKHLKSFFI